MAGGTNMEKTNIENFIEKLDDLPPKEVNRLFGLTVIRRDSSGFDNAYPKLLINKYSEPENEQDKKNQKVISPEYKALKRWLINQAGLYQTQSQYKGANLLDRFKQMCRENYSYRYQNGISSNFYYARDKEVFENLCDKEWQEPLNWAREGYVQDVLRDAYLDVVYKMIDQKNYSALREQDWENVILHGNPAYVRKIPLKNVPDYIDSSKVLPSHQNGILYNYLKEKRNYEQGKSVSAGNITQYQDFYKYLHVAELREVIKMIDKNLEPLEQKDKAYKKQIEEGKKSKLNKEKAKLSLDISSKVVSFLTKLQEATEILATSDLGFKEPRSIIINIESSLQCWQQNDSITEIEINDNLLKKQKAILDGKKGNARMSALDKMVKSINQLLKENPDIKKHLKKYSGALLDDLMLEDAKKKENEARKKFNEVSSPASSLSALPLSDNDANRMKGLRKQKEIIVQHIARLVTNKKQDHHDDETDTFNAITQILDREKDKLNPVAKRNARALRDSLLKDPLAAKQNGERTK